MKKLLFSALAIAMLSTTAVQAGDKTPAKKHKATTTCPAGCPKSKDCKQGVPCPKVPGCVCS